MAKRHAKNTAERQQLMKEVQGLLYNVKRREKRIERHGGKKSPAFRGKTYKSITRRTKKGLRGKSTKQLQELKNDLLYVKSLPTSYVKGYEKYSPVFDKSLRGVGRSTQKKIFRLWNELVGEGGVYAIYKYEVFKVIANSYETGKRDEKSIRERVDRLADEWYNRDNGVPDDFYDLSDTDDEDDIQDYVDRITDPDMQEDFYDESVSKSRKRKSRKPTMRKSSSTRRKSRSTKVRSRTKR